MPDQVAGSNAYFEKEALVSSMENAISRKKEMQEIRFSAVVKDLGLTAPPDSLIDFGCGTGNFLKFLIDKDLKPRRYVGYDSWEAALTRASMRFQDKGSVDFLQCPIQSLFSAGIAEAEYAVCLAVISHRATSLSKMQDMMMDTLDLAYQSCTIGCAVSALSSYKTNALENEAIFDPAWLWQIGRRLSERVLIDHSYAPESLIVLIKEKSAFRRLWEKEGGWK